MVRGISGKTQEDYAAFMVVTIICLVITIPIMLGCYFGIWFPYDSRTWDSTTCRITGVQTYRTWQVYDFFYLQYKVAVEIDGKEYPGYGCESSGFSDSTDMESGGGYPYNTIICNDFINEGQCLSEQLLMPKWLCSYYQNAPAFDVGDLVSCKWALNIPTDGTDSEPEDVSDFSYPRKGEYYIEVIFMDEVNTPNDEYIAMWVVGWGFCVFVPLLLLMWAALGFSAVWTRHEWRSI